MAGKNKNGCYKISCPIYGSFNIKCDYETSSIVLWNKFQLLIYYSADFKNKPTVIRTNFEIKKVLINNYQLLCLDHEGYLNVRNINTNDNTDQISSENFVRKCELKNVFTCEIFNKDYVISVLLDDVSELLDENERAVKLSINKFINNFDFHAEFKLNITHVDWTRIETGKSIITYKNIKPEHSNELKHKFNKQNSNSEHTLLVISLDRINVYMCLIDIMQEENIIENRNVQVLKLHTSHSEIVGIQITVTDTIYILLVLATGTIVKVPLINSDLNREAYHLYSKIYKFSIFNNTIVYTDGLTMWKTEHLFSKTNQISKEFVVRNVKDFCIIANRVICTTFLDLIYSLYINSDKSYKSENVNCCPVNLVTNSHCLLAINNVVKENDEVVKIIEKEKEYFTSVALSKREDIMDTVIDVTVNVYDNYEVLKGKITELTLTDELSSYNDTQSYFFLIKVSAATVQHKLNKLLSNMLVDIKIHVTIKSTSPHQVIKTTSIKLNSQLKNENFVLSLKRRSIKTTNIEVHVKMITNFQERTDKNQRHWIVLYQKNIILNASYFIITPTFSKTVCLKEENNITLDELICKTEERLYDSLYRFNVLQYQWSVYVMLPKNNANVLNNKKIYENYWHSEKIDDLLKPNLLGAIYTTKNGIKFQIGHEEVVLNIDDTSSTSKRLCSALTLCITSPNISLISEIRKMFSDSIFSYYKDCKDLTEYVDCDLLEHIKNLKTDIETRSKSGPQNEIDENLYTEVHQAIFKSQPI